MKRFVRSFFLVFAVIALASCAWPMARNDAARTGFNQFETAITPNNVSNLDVRWTAPLDFDNSDSPVVANGRVFIGSSDQGGVSAYDATGHISCSSATPRSCNALWHSAAGNTVGGSPAVVNGVVYVVADTFGVANSGALHAFDATTGKRLWTAATGGDPSTSPVVTNGVVYVGSRNVLAFDAAGVTGCSGVPKTCTPLWTAETGGSASSPTVANGVVYAGSNNGKVYAFDAAGHTNCAGSPKSCTPLFTANAGGAVGDVAVGNGFLYTNSNGKLYAFDAGGKLGCSGTPKTCTPRWTATAGGAKGDVAIASGRVYTGSQDGKVYVFDAAGNTNCAGTPKSCNPLWTTVAIGSSGLSVANGVLYVAGNDVSQEAVNAFDASGCSQAVCNPIAVFLNGVIGDELQTLGDPVIANGWLYVNGQEPAPQGGNQPPPMVYAFSLT